MKPQDEFRGGADAGVGRTERDFAGYDFALFVAFQVELKPAFRVRFRPQRDTFHADGVVARDLREVADGSGVVGGDIGHAALGASPQHGGWRQFLHDDMEILFDQAVAVVLFLIKQERFCGIPERPGRIAVLAEIDLDAEVSFLLETEFGADDRVESFAFRVACVREDECLRSFILHVCGNVAQGVPLVVRDLPLDEDFHGFHPVLAHLHHLQERPRAQFLAFRRSQFPVRIRGGSGRFRILIRWGSVTCGMKADDSGAERGSDQKYSVFHVISPVELVLLIPVQVQALSRCC